MRRGDVGALHVHAGAKVLGVMYAGGMEVYAGHANKAVCCPPPPATPQTHIHTLLPWPASTLCPLPGVVDTKAGLQQRNQPPTTSL
jgi:hypothetical protein